MLTFPKSLKYPTDEMQRHEFPISNEKPTMSTVTRTDHEERLFKIKGCAITFAILMFLIMITLRSDIEVLAKFGCFLLCTGVSHHFYRVDRCRC